MQDHRATRIEIVNEWPERTEIECNCHKLFEHSDPLWALQLFVEHCMAKSTHFDQTVYGRQVEIDVEEDGDFNAFWQEVRQRTAEEAMAAAEKRKTKLRPTITSWKMP